MASLQDQLKLLVTKAEDTKSQAVGAVIEEFRDVFDSLQLRLRPSVGSMSLVSYADRTPQRGFENIRNADHLRRTLDALRSRTKAIEPPGRSTPEKHLQSWLIGEAMRNGRQVVAVARPLGDRHKYHFVSDELAFKQGVEKFVADLLLIREDASGESEFVATELKYKRDPWTHSQVRKFKEILENESLLPLWRGFAENMLGAKLRWKKSNRCCGLVIWPFSSRPAHATRALVASCRDDESIETLGYVGPPYSLQLEGAAITIEGAVDA
jgi:hypothetical protein